MSTIAQDMGRNIYKDFYNISNELKEMGISNVNVLELTTSRGTDFVFEVDNRKLLLSPESTIERITGDVLGFEVHRRSSKGVEKSIARFEIDTTKMKAKQMLLY